MTLSLTKVRRVLGMFIVRKPFHQSLPPGLLKPTVYCPAHRVDRCVGHGAA